MRLNIAALLEQLASMRDALGTVQTTTSAQQQQQQQTPQRSHAEESTSAAVRRRAKVVANLPYNITKEFLLALLPTGNTLSELSIMIQEEVARRLCDPTPGRPDYRAMSVITHYYAEPVYRFMCGTRLTSCSRSSLSL